MRKKASCGRREMLASSVRRMLQDTRGAIAVLFGVVLLMIMFALGMAIDLGRLVIVRNELKQMADGAVLGASAIIGNKTEPTLRAQAQRYINAQPISSVTANVTVEESVYHANTKSYQLTLRATLNSSILKVFDIDTLSVTATAQSLRALPGPVEMVIVADYTVSMGTSVGWGVGDGSRLAALQGAASKLIDDLSEYEDVSIGVVPFSTHINVDPDRWRQKRVVGSTELWSDTEEAAQWLSLLVSSQIRDWTGCIGVRRQNLRATLGDLAAQKYPRFSNPPACLNSPLPSMLPLARITTSAAAIKNSFARRGGGGASFVPAGLMGAWHLLDPAVPFREAKSFDEMTRRGGRKVVVLLTDGGNITGPSSSLATMLMLSSGLDEANRIQAGLCNGIKAAGIEIYVISFLQGDPNQVTQEPLLQNCATPGGRHFFSVNSANGLSDAFNDITSRLVQVRLTQ